MMNASVRYSSNSNLNKQIKKMPSESEDIATYNIFKIIASICNACVSKICDFLPTPSVPTFATSLKPCNYEECMSYVDHIKNHELCLLYENKIHEKLDHVKYKNDSCKLCYACNCSNNQAKSITYAPWQQMAKKDPAFENDGQIDLKQLSQFGIPNEKYIQDFHSASIENYPCLIQGKHVDVYDPICDKVCYFCGRFECKDKPRLEWYLRDNLESQKLKCKSFSVCKCSLCECLSCPFQKEASFAESLENFETNVMHNYVENEWKSRLRGNKHEIQACRTPKDFKHFRDSTKIIVGKLSKEKCSVKYSKHGHDRKSCQFSHKDSTFNKIPVKKFLDNVDYGSDIEIEENDKNVSTVNPNKLQTEQLLKNMYGEYTVVNNETNTENFTADECTETANLLGNKKSYVDNKVKNYEYTLKIEIMIPNLDDNIKQDMKQRIQRASKNKIKKQTQNVMKDVIKDISNNSLLHEMFRTENPIALQPSDSKTSGDMGHQEQSKIRSILKKNSTVSFKSTTTENQNSSDMATSLPRSKGSKMEDFIVGCVTPLKNTSGRTGNEIDANKSELPSRDESALSQNYWSPVPPAQLSLRTQVDVMEKLVSCVDAPTADMNVNKSGKCLDDLRVQEPCLRRVSNHTVSLKWKLPKLIEEIMGYEILVDGKTIEKILNPKRCLAVVSCLPPVRRLMITIRTLPKSPSLRGLYPCTTIGYQPRANKFIPI